jgi:SAM-dependent methyltransferase
VSDGERGAVAALNGPAAVFNEVATLYDEVRPGYPAAIVDAILAFAALHADGRILEIGCGTGQITLPFAERGYGIVALEPGDALAALAARKCRPYPAVRVVPTSFEAWPLEAHAFDLVLAAQSFHWIAADEGYLKAASALRPGGAIALVWHFDVSHDTPFWQATLPIYDRYLPTPADGSAPTLADQVARHRDALRSCDAFIDARELRHHWARTYAGDDYLKLLNTFSNHRSLPEPARSAFFEAVADVIGRTGGAVHRKYETVLLLARTRGEAPAVDLRPLLERTYAAFNARDVDAVLAVMHPDVDWPNGLEGGRVVGRRAVREYWTRQWGLIDPAVEPKRFSATDDGRVDVEVDQVVRDLAGNVLKAETVHHVYAFADGLITSMEIRPC